MKIIADSGSTKTNWVCIEDRGECTRFSSKGYNPNYLSEDEMEHDMLAAMPSWLKRNEVKEVCFYGAGIIPMLEPLMERVLRQLFPCAQNVTATTDLMGAAKALLGDASGLAVIIGTGMNSCIYNGKGIAQRVSSLGFVLGDEGSGAYIGKTLIREYLRHHLSDHTYNIVREHLQMTDDELIHRIYRQPEPNRFCASLCQLIGKYQTRNQDFHDIVEDAFEAMFAHVITQYEHYETYKLNAVGSVAFHFQGILKEVARRHGMDMGMVLCDPLDGLINYHSK